ncbi:MAG: universal stress protein [Desulfobulbus sp.]|jgi:nucleotide-binding universal stress UspA family protein|uniref:universal stress protein n=1 Tax=Desulfobulbus sp. TaxID=895 RepID=UPI00284B4580|nr:universal stress protein [Desulfobulbus sp.]MDR2550971.1 universal stress protein [Desulfobulbus sp.]
MPARIATILVAIDPGNASQTALHQALELALFLRAELVAVSVTPRYEGNMHRWKISNADEQLSQPFKQCLEEARRIAAASGQELRTIHTVGDPVQEIVRTAEEQQAGLLLLGYPKRTRIERVLLGRTAAKVIGGSPCDVLMVPEQAEVHFSRILVGIDGSSFSMEAGQRALGLALAFGGEVHALTVLDIPVERGFLYGVLDEARQKSFPPLQTLAGQGQRLGVRVVTEIREGSPYATIVNYSQERDIELIVLGSYGRTALGDILMGSVVERVTSLSSCPTLVVKKR